MNQLIAKLQTLPKIVVFAAVILISSLGIISVKFLGANNPLEIAAEKVIKAETGETVDLATDEKEIENALENEN